MDDVDRGNETAEKTLAGYINRIRARAQHPLVPGEECHNCGEQLRTEVLFCSSDCRADYDYREQIRRRTSAQT